MAMMISKFHKIIQSKTVWGVFAVLISVAFVGVYTGAKSNNRNAAQSGTSDKPAGTLFGEEVSRLEFGRAYQSAYLMLVMQTGQPININAQIDDILRTTAWQRLALLAKARQMGLIATDEQIANTIRAQSIFMNSQTGAFDRNAYDAFFSQILPQLGLRMSPKDFEILISENLLIDKATSVAVQGALATDSEVDHAFHIYSDQLTVQYAMIPRSLAETPEITEEDAREYYADFPNQFTYPDKVKVRYVDFPVADYTNDVEVTDDMVTNFYANYKERYVVEGTEMDAVPQYQPMDDVRNLIVDEVKTALARRKAATDAGMFVSMLSGQTTTFDELAEAQGLSISISSPFAITDTVRGVDPTATFAQAAFSLQDDANHYFSDPVVGKDHIYVLVLEDRMPAFLPDFDVVADEAMDAARITAEENAYVQKAETIHADIETALNNGVEFDEAATMAGLLVVTMEPFSVSAPPTNDVGQVVLQATALFDSGSFVDLTSTDDEFMVAYVAQREAADRSSADPDLIAQLKNSVLSDKAGRLAEAWRDSVLDEAHLEDLLNESDGDNS